jgi:hypothetical protein
MKDDRTTDKRDTYDPLIAASLQIVILQGMINAGVVDRLAMRTWLQSRPDHAAGQL